MLTFSLAAVGLCIFSLASRHFSKLTTDIWEHMVEVRRPTMANDEFRGNFRYNRRLTCVCVCVCFFFVDRKSQDHRVAIHHGTIRSLHGPGRLTIYEGPSNWVNETRAHTYTKIQREAGCPRRPLFLVFADYARQFIAVAINKHSLNRILYVRSCRQLVCVCVNLGRRS